MGEDDIHPPVFIEIEDAGAERGGCNGSGPWHAGREVTLSRIRVDHWRTLPIRNYEISSAIVIKVTRDHAQTRVLSGNSGLGCDTGKCAIAIVAPQRITGAPRVGREFNVAVFYVEWSKRSDVQIKIT